MFGVVGRNEIERIDELLRILLGNALSAAERAKLSTVLTFAGPAVLTWGNSSVAATVTTRFLEPGYESSLAPTATVQYRIPFAGTFRNMRVHARVGAGNGNAIVYTLRVNGVVSALSVSMASTAVDGSDLADTVAVAAGDLVDIQVTKALGIGASPTDITCSLQFGGP